MVEQYSGPSTSEEPAQDITASGSLAVFPPHALFAAVERSSGNLRLVIRQPASGGLTVVVFRGGSPTMVFSPGDGRSLGDLMVEAGAINRAVLAELVAERPHTQSPLERLVIARTGMRREEIRAFLDFQARARLLDVLTWRDGTFSVTRYEGGEEGSFSLQLPPLEALVARAEARAAALPPLLASLPARPRHTVVRRRRGGSEPGDALGGLVWRAIREPLLVPELIARTRVDDDLVMDRVVALAEARAVVLEPRVALVQEPSEARLEPVREDVVRAIHRALRGTRGGGSSTALWAVVVAAEVGDAARFVELFGAGPQAGAAAAPPVGVASCAVPLGGTQRLCLLAVRPDTLQPGVLDGVLSRCDALVLLRTAGGAEDASRLSELWRQVASRARRQPVALGVEIGAVQGAWTGQPGAVLSFGGWDVMAASSVLPSFLEGLLAAARGAEGAGDDRFV